MSSKPNWGRPLALAAVLVVLGSLSYWLVYTHKPKEDEQDEQNKKIAQLSSEKGQDKSKDRQIQTITLDNGTGTRLSVACLDVALQVCKPGSSPKWEMAEPLKVKADDSNINSLISTLNNLNASDTISLKDETPEKKVALLKEYGLDPAAVTAGKTRSIQVETTSGNLGLYLGQQHPIGDGTFVVVEHTDAGKKLTGQFDQNQVYVIPSYIKTNFDKPTNFWREKKLLTIGSHDVATFHLKDTHADVEGTLQNGQWTLQSKTGSKIEELPGDVESIDNMLNGVAFLVAKDFASDNKTDAKAKAILRGARPIITLSMEKAKPATPSPGSSGTPAAEQPAPIVLTLFAKDAHKEKNGVVQVRLFATVSNQDPLYEVESFAKDRMDKEVKELRLSKLITSMDRFTAKKLMFEGGSLSNPIRLAMKDSKWADTDNPQTTIDSEKVQSLLDKLAGDKVQEFIPLAKAPADVKKGESTGLTFSLGDETAPAKRKIVFWKVADNSLENPKDKSGKKGAGFKLYAHDLNSPRKEIFLMDSSAAQGLPWDKNSFLKVI
jgi:hypothetical protein